jgi:type IV secretory pathway TrbD component
MFCQRICQLFRKLIPVDITVQRKFKPFSHSFSSNARVSSGLHCTKHERRGIMNMIGRIAFIIGVLLCVAVGFVTQDWIFWALTLLGVLVGILNIQQKEIMKFLWATIALVVVSAFGATQISTFPTIGPVVGRIYMALLTFVSPAAIIVALKAVFHLAKD